MTADRDNVHRNFGGECFPGDLSPYVMVPTDAHQVEMMVDNWDKARKITHHYEFLIYTGEYKGMPVSACSTGMGGMSVAIAMEELARLGADTFMHVGVCDARNKRSSAGEIVIARGAVRLDGTSFDYVRPEYPALAHFELVMAAAAAAERLSLPYQIGIIASLASSGSERKDDRWGVLQERMADTQRQLDKAGVLAGSGEEAPLFVASSIYGFRAGALNVYPYQDDGSIDLQVEEHAVLAGLEAMRIVAEWDEMKKKSGLSYIVPE